MKGYYTLIQFCPDRSRLEAANIGLILTCPEKHFVGSRIVESNDKLRRFFHGLDLDLDLIKFQKKSIQRRIESSCSELIDPDNLRKFAQSRGNQILISEPRPISIDDDPRAKLSQLFIELIGDRPERSKTKDFEEKILLELERSIATAGLQDKISKKVSVKSKSLDRTITAPLAYQNGKLNLVIPREFAHSSTSAAETAACKLAVEGNALFKHPDDRLGEMQLVAVCSFRLAAQSIKKRIKTILADNNVEAIASSDLDALVERIKTTAH